MDGAATSPDLAKAAEATPSPRDRLRALAAALKERGLSVRIGKGALVARNPAASHTADPVGRAMNPGLSQYVALSEREDGSLHRYWCWAGPERDSPLEMEHMCPAGEIERAAGLIANVLRAGAEG